MAKEKQIQVPVDDLEKELFEKMSLVDGYRSVAAWIRDKCLNRGEFSETEPLHFHGIHNKTGN